MEEQYCRQCGQALRQTDRFCPGCGRPVAPAPELPDPAPAAPVQKPPGPTVFDLMEPQAAPRALRPGYTARPNERPGYAPAPPPAEPPSKNSRGLNVMFLVLVGIALFLVGVLIVVIIAKPWQNHTANNAETGISQAAGPLSAGLGDEIIIGGVHYKVTAAQLSRGGFLQAPEGTLVLALTLEVQNASSANFYFHYLNFSLYADDQIAGVFDGENVLYISELAPGKNLAGILYYQVPDDFETLELHIKGSSLDKTAAAVLTLRRAEVAGP